MTKISSSVEFCFTLAKFQTSLSRAMDTKLNGISLNELIILYNISSCDDQKIRRIDLANKIGLTASGVTRLLLPMEKIGLIKRESNERDARVSLVTITKAGKEKLKESLERAELLFEDIIEPDKIKSVKNSTKLLSEIAKNITQ